MKKIVLCRPMGGLNDMLCQIEMCWRYAETHNRTCIIDTVHSGLGDEFSKYFKPRDQESDVRLALKDDELGVMQSMSTIPPIIQGKLGDYLFVYDGKVDNWVEKDSKQRLTFDFATSYSEDILVHQQCGGGQISVDALARLRFNDSIAEEIWNRLKTLTSPYTAIHVRNTDLKTDYIDFFKKIEFKVKDKRLLICSDDSRCVEYAKGFFDKSEVVTVSELQDTAGRPQHSNPSICRYRANIDMLSDLLGLSMSKELLFARVSQGRVSGFSKLAGLLSKQFMRVSQGHVSGFSQLAELLKQWHEILYGLFPQHIRERLTLK